LEVCEVIIIFSRIRLLGGQLLSLAFLLGTTASAYSAGLGELRVSSALGQNLQAEIRVIGDNADSVESSCVRAKIETTEGVFITPAVTLVRQSGASRSIFLTTRVNLNEPALKVIVDLSCESPLRREFLILLDPPILNSSAKKETESPTISESRREQQNVFQSRTIDNNATSQAPRKPTQRIRTQSQNVVSVEPKIPVSQIEEKKNKSKKKVTGALEARKDVLRLSDDLEVVPGLKTSSALSSPNDHPLLENLAELRQAQLQLAAMLRDEKTAGREENAPSKELAQLQKLQSEMAQLKKQSLVDKAALDEIKRDSFSKNWVFGLSAIAGLGALVILLLIFYIRKLHTASNTLWWEQGKERKEVARRKNLEDMVNDIQASYEPEASFNPDDLKNFSESVRDTTPSVKAVNASLLSNTDQLFQPDESKLKTPTLEDTNTSIFNFFATRGSSVKVEEISDVTQEAEFWMSVNDPHRAIEILDSQANIEQPDSPLPWLYLLDLYRIVKDKEKYDELKQRFTVFFNANIPEFELKPSEDERHLEDMSHLIDKICSMWNGPELLPFLKALLVDDRDGKRTGFELSVYKDLLLLISVANEIEKQEGLVPRRCSSEKPLSAIGQPQKSSNSKMLETDLDLGMIEFEVIDFPKEDAVKINLPKK
jgi:pilus assembly protein FimV